ncbi:CopG family transcriptional regulator [Psychrobacillus glaciei]|uniref:CopG family transcriptional regulator n=2 Tax=Psychrobacillus glaciei TaxID=2283160 RepID=A0A5J6SR13_9BACI|nr:CopG family transcriptional regulator [Psychrobacillus glaciei]
MNVVDLGKVDLLVEQGFYSNRTDFNKTSIRNQLSIHANVVDNILTDKSYLIGVIFYSRERLEKVLEQNKILDIKVVGMVVIADNIGEELAIKTIKSLKVFGVLKATPEIKKILKQ